MDNPKYAIAISYVPLRENGTQELNTGNGTFSIPGYSGNYFLASMPELLISATGTSYNNALSNLLIIATSSSVQGNGHPPLY